AEQPADGVVALEDRYLVPGPGELLGGGEPGRPGPDHGGGEAGAGLRHERDDPAVRPGAVDDLDLDLLDGDRVGINAEHAGRLAGRGAQPPGELGEVVGRVQPVGRGGPVRPVDQVVPLGDEVAERAAVVAERDAAV